MNVLDVPRNDPHAAIAFYKQWREAEGEVPGDVVAILIRLQDDPDAFFDLMAKENA